MYRKALSDAKKWLQNDGRKPLLIRGARQVGKTWLARELAEISEKQLVELNFEHEKELASLFEGNNPKKIIQRIEARFLIAIEVSNALLFLDEVQATPEIIAKLRWFAEEMPELSVIATGSLLEFALEDYQHSMPVGRINYLYLEPLSFEEFLIAKGAEKQVEYLSQLVINEPLPKALHQTLMTSLREYIFIGGMPAAVEKYVTSNSFDAIAQIHQDLLTTYQDDFSKYASKPVSEHLSTILIRAPMTLGEKFVYTRVNPDASVHSTKHALSLLNKARVIHSVTACSANALPLAAEKKERFFKALFIDTGLANSKLGFNLHHWLSIPDTELANKSGISEQLAGQLLRCIEPYYINPELFYWVSSKKGSEAEIDYILAHQQHIIPIEVKAGKTGTMKSLHQFMANKKLKLAVRINADIPSIVEVDVQTNLGDRACYTLISIPFYLIGQLHRLLDDYFKQ